MKPHTIPVENSRVHCSAPAACGGRQHEGHGRSTPRGLQQQIQTVSGAPVKLLSRVSSTSSASSSATTTHRNVARAVRSANRAVGPHASSSLQLTTTEGRPDEPAIRSSVVDRPVPEPPVTTMNGSGSALCSKAAQKVLCMVYSFYSRTPRAQ